MAEMTAAKAARNFRNFAAALKRELRAAEEENVADILETAGSYSAQDVPLSELERRHHPYGIGPATPAGAPRGALPLPPEFISARDDEVLRSWETEGPRETGGGLESAVFNSSPIAEWLENGTPTTRPRPLKEAVEKATGPRIEKRRDRAFDAASKELTK